MGKKRRGATVFNTIPAKSMWQTTAMDHAVAEELFGWKWVAFKSIPVRGTPGYPERCTVRQFMHPDTFTNKRWLSFFEEAGGWHEATGDEPLAYCYCSSMGPAMVPHFSGHEDAVREIERELNRRGVLDKYDEILAAKHGKRARFAPCEDKCIAALAAVGSKYVTQDEQS